MKMKIGQVAKASGVPTTTIHYYVKEGLLQAPEKINKRVSLYDESIIDRLKVIQSLQERRFPLFTIKKILMRMDQGVPREEAEAVENAIYDLAVSKSNALIDRKGYMEQTGLTAKEMEELERVGLLMPFHTEKGKPLYDHDDVAMGKSVFKNFFRFNVPLEELRFYVDLGQKITEEELNLRKKFIKDMSLVDNARVTVDLTNAAILCRAYFLKRIFQRTVEKRAKTLSRSQASGEN